MYQPLPQCLTLERIGERLSLITTRDIPKGQNLGICEVKDSRFADGLVRTPLGGFLTESEVSNTHKKDMGTHFCLITSLDIPKGDEIVVFESTSKWTLDLFGLKIRLL